MGANRLSQAQRGAMPKPWLCRATRPPVARPLWLLLACIHVPGIWFTWNAFTTQWDPSLLIRVVALTISVVFLGLKVFDISWLRMPPGWRAQVAVVLIVILLHCGVVGRALNAEPQDAGAFDTPALLAFCDTASAMILWRILLRCMWSRLGRQPADCCIPSPSQRSGAEALLARRDSDALLLPALAPRPPPATCRPPYPI